MSPTQICSALWVILAVVWVVARIRSKQTRERAPFISRLAYLLPVIFGFYLVFNGQSRYRWLKSELFPQSLGLDVFSVTLTAVGVALAIWARFYLGQNWSSSVTIKVDHQLIRSGPYKWVRHPIYSGFLLAVIGTALNRREARGLVAIVLLWLAFWIKSRMEEVFMRKTFGAQYEDYSASTGALIPRLKF